MRRSRSRTSKISTRNDPALSADKIFLDKHDSKWNDFLQEEESDMFILQIRDEILSKCLEICYEKYMERQGIAFTVHCAYLAWVKVINVYYMPRDEENDEDIEEKESWMPDEEPETALVDSWAAQFMTVNMDMSKKKDSPSPQRTPSEVSDTGAGDSVRSVPYVYYPDPGEYEEREFRYLGEFPGESLELCQPRKRSIFTRTLSMPREMLLLFQPANLSLGQCKEEIVNFKKKIHEEILQPTYIDVSQAMPNWIDVEYSIEDSTHKRSSVKRNFRNGKRRRRKRYL